MHRDVCGRTVCRRYQGDAPSLERLGEPGSSDDRRPRARLQQGRGRLCRRHQLAGIRLDPDPAEHGHIVGQGGAGVVGQERHRLSGVAETSDGLG